MDKGFFVLLVKRRATVGEAAAQWKAELLQALPGWAKTTGETMDMALRRQKEQYDARLALNEPVPALVDANGGPMASGQTIRFVSVGTG